MASIRQLAQLLLRMVAAGILLDCTPAIGDKCSLSTDCSVQGDRLCDTSQPDGYCTEFNCKGNSCPDKAACVLFNSAVPGCVYDDRDGRFGGRTARSFCVARCESDADCRAGYVCADPRSPQFGALILDNDQTQKTCLVKPIGYDNGTSTLAPTTNAQVCGPSDAGVMTPIDASPATLDSGLGPLEAPDAGGELDGAAGDAGDAGADGG